MDGQRPPRPGADARTVSEVVAAFWKHAETYYRNADGTAAGELDNFRLALRPLKRLYGPTLAQDFGPLALKALMAEMVKLGWCRNYVNRQAARIKAVFKWAVGAELVPASVHQALTAVAGLRKGKADARESEPVKPVPLADVEAVLPLVGRQVKAMIELQLLTGARPTEVCMMRPVDLDTSGPVWVYAPPKHKTSHHDIVREIRLGPKAQEIVRPFLAGRPVNAYLFSPAEAEAERLEARRKARNPKTPVTPSQRLRAEKAAKRQRRRGARERYDRNSYRRAVARACEVAFGMPAELKPVWKETPEQRKEKAAAREKWHAAHGWHPNQLRHTRATEIRKRYGLDAARAVLGHTSVKMTTEYAELDAKQVEKIMVEVG